MLRAHYRNMTDDEALIGKGYRQGRSLVSLYCIAPVVGFYFGSDKGAYFAAFCVIMWLLGDLGDRLYDLTIRLSRSNELLVDGVEQRRTRKELH